MSPRTFDSFDLPEPVLRGIKEAGFEFCTPIQEKTLPHTLAGKDIAGQAQTGTGKTAAFLITLFSRLVQNPPPEPKGKRTDWVAPRALVIAPTRELALQIHRDAEVLGRHCGLRMLCIYGGMDYEKQKNQIQQGVDIMIVTPGRIIDFYKQRFFSLKSIEILVIDEADRMFDMGFIADLRFLLRNISSYDKRLSMLFSATLSHRVMELCYEHMNVPEKVEVEPEKATVDKIRQLIYHVGSHEKFNLLLGLLKSEPEGKFLIFCNMKETVDLLEAQLIYNGLNAAQISGDLHQKKRIKVLEQFTEGKVNILIATDVASRGIHVDDITHVVNYDLPQDPEDYIHRIGRTARAGANGTAVSFGCEDYVMHLERIEEALKTSIPIEWAEEEMFVEPKEGMPTSMPRRRSSPNGKPRPKSQSPRGRRPSSGGRRRPSSRPRSSRPKK